MGRSLILACSWKFTIEDQTDGLVLYLVEVGNDGTHAEEPSYGEPGNREEVGLIWLK